MSSPVEQDILASYCSGWGANICCGNRAISNAIGVDHDPNAKAGLIQADARLLPFYDDALDYIISAHGLEHIQDGPLLVIREWIRCIKVGGRLALVVPNGSGREQKALEYNASEGKMNIAGHCHIFTPDILRAMLKQAGLIKVEVKVLDRSKYWDSDVILGTGIKSAKYQVPPITKSKLLWLWRTIKSANIKGQIAYRFTRQ